MIAKTARPSRPFRIAFGRITQETNAFSPEETTLEHFRRIHLLEGDDLLRVCGRFRSEVPGLIRNAELSGFCRAAHKLGRGQVELVPLLSAWALPAGPLSKETYAELRERLVESLRNAGPVDAVFFSLHGAMRGQAPDSEPEEGFLAAIREVVGEAAPVAITLDLHGQLTPVKVGATTILSAYRTNPHRDLYGTGYRAGALLLRTLRGEVRPVHAWRSLPMILGGGLTIDFLRPVRKLFRHMKAMERDPRVLSVSLFLCHIWNDSPDLGWSVYVLTDGDTGLAERLADELAEMAWSVRHELPPHVPEPAEALEQVRQSRVARRLGTTCLVDVSDVTAAGSIGENTHVLRALLDQGQGLLAYVPLRDAVAVEALWERPVGADVTQAVGGRFDAELSPPLEVRGRILAKKTSSTSGRAVVLALGDVRLVLTEHAPLTLKPGFYSELGLSPWKADVVVVKSFFHFRIYFAGVNRKTIGIRTRGLTDFNLYEQVQHHDAVHPKDPVEDWRGADRRRRVSQTLEER